MDEDATLEHITGIINPRPVVAYLDDEQLWLFARSFLTANEIGKFGILCGDREYMIIRFEAGGPILFHSAGGPFKIMEMALIQLGVAGEFRLVGEPSFTYAAPMLIERLED